MDKEIRAKLENERQKEQEKIIQGKLLLISRYRYFFNFPNYILKLELTIYFLYFSREFRKSWKRQSSQSPIYAWT